MLGIYLIYLDSTKNLPDEPESNQRSKRSTYQKDSEAHQESVPEVKQVGEKHVTCFKMIEPDETISEEKE